MPIATDIGLTTIKVTGTTETSSKITDGLTKIKTVYWYDPATAGDLLVLVDKRGGSITQLRAESDHGSQQWDINCAYDGIYTTDMDSGTLYIYR